MSLKLSCLHLQLTYVNKAGWLFKRGKLQQRWLRRWYTVNTHKGSFRYCDRPSQVQLLLSLAAGSPTWSQVFAHTVFLVGYPAFGSLQFDPEIVGQT